jgi:lipopolysaccharide export system protein LptA
VILDPHFQETSMHGSKSPLALLTAATVAAFALPAPGGGYTFNGFTVSAPRFAVDQTANTLSVNGTGRMTLPDSMLLRLTGDPKKDAHLQVYWDRDMLFDGKRAVLNGNVQLLQDQLSLRCDNMEYKLTEIVPLGENAKGGAKLERILCDKKVTFTETILDKCGRTVKVTGLGATRLDVNCLEEQVTAAGPGQLMILSDHRLHFVTAELDPAVPHSANLGQRLTRIFFDGAMHTRKIGDRHLVVFRDNVRVLHFPAEKPNEEMNPDKPRKDGFYLKCDELKIVADAKDARGGRTIEARGNVEVRAENLFIRARSLTFRDSSDLVVLEGSADTEASVYQYAVANTPTIKGRKIVYNRSTGAIHVD